MDCGAVPDDVALSADERAELERLRAEVSDLRAHKFQHRCRRASPLVATQLHALSEPRSGAEGLSNLGPDNALTLVRFLSSGPFFGYQSSKEGRRIIHSG